MHSMQEQQLPLRIGKQRVCTYTPALCTDIGAAPFLARQQILQRIGHCMNGVK
jgi:hypothetical protein